MRIMVGYHGKVSRYFTERIAYVSSGNFTDEVPLLIVTFGGLSLMRILNCVWGVVACARIVQNCPRLMYYIDGNVQEGLGSEFKGKRILVFVGAHGKYIVVHIMSLPSSSEAERMLQRTFDTHGSSHEIVSGNASSFTRKKCSNFCALNGIKHVRFAPYYPSLSRLSERALKTMENGLKKFQVIWNLDYYVS